MKNPVFLPKFIKTVSNPGRENVNSGELYYNCSKCSWNEWLKGVNLDVILFKKKILFSLNKQLIKFK